MFFSCTTAYLCNGFEHTVDVLEGLADQLFAANVAHVAGGNEGTVVTALFCLLCGQVAFPAAAELNEEGLLRQGPGLDLVAVVQKQLKGVGGDGDGAQADDVHLGG